MISISGSNPNSITDFLVYDNPMCTYIDYVYSHDKSLKPQILQGINSAFETLIHCVEYNGTLTLTQYLTQLMNGYVGTGRNVELVVTGGSLGGSLSLLLGLYLSDIKSVWDPQSISQLSVYSYAAFSFGNQDFKTYYLQQIGAQTSRIWNSLDFVPNLFNPYSLLDVPNKYVPWNIPPPKLVYAMVLVYELLLQGKVPVHCTDDPALYMATFLDVSGDTPFETFMTEEAQQHFVAYMNILGCPEVIGWLLGSDPIVPLFNYFVINKEEAKKIYLYLCEHFKEQITEALIDVNVNGDYLN